MISHFDHFGHLGCRPVTTMIMTITMTVTEATYTHGEFHRLLFCHQLGIIWLQNVSEMLPGGRGGGSWNRRSEVNRQLVPSLITRASFVIQHLPIKCKLASVSCSYVVLSHGSVILRFNRWWCRCCYGLQSITESARYHLAPECLGDASWRKKRRRKLEQGSEVNRQLVSSSLTRASFVIQH